MILSVAVSWLRTLRYVGVRARRRRRREIFFPNFVRRFVGDFPFRGKSLVTKEEAKGGAKRKAEVTGALPPESLSTSGQGSRKLMPEGACKQGEA